MNKEGKRNIYYIYIESMNLQIKELIYTIYFIFVLELLAGR